MTHAVLNNVAAGDSLAPLGAAGLWWAPCWRDLILDVHEEFKRCREGNLAGEGLCVSSAGSPGSLQVQNEFNAAVMSVCHSYQCPGISRHGREGIYRRRTSGHRAI